MEPAIVEHHQIYSAIPQDQLDRVFGQDMIDIDGEFPGFMDIYEALAKIIPKHFVVIDLGAAYNPQAFYFTEHVKYIAVDIGNIKRFQPSNCDIYEMDAEQFINDHTGSLNLAETFAICNYLGGRVAKAARRVFPNLFVFYPSGGESILLNSLTFQTRERQ